LEFARVDRRGAVHHFSPSIQRHLCRSALWSNDMAIVQLFPWTTKNTDQTLHNNECNVWFGGLDILRPASKTTIESFSVNWDELECCSTLHTPKAHHRGVVPWFFPGSATDQCQSVHVVSHVTNLLPPRAIGICPMCAVCCHPPNPPTHPPMVWMVVHPSIVPFSNMWRMVCGPCVRAWGWLRVPQLR
jgi:hypothetical protein